MTPPFAEGYYLEDNPPARKQWGTRPIGRINSVVVLHTAEGSYRGSLNWIRDRSTAGSYQVLGSLGGITRLMPYEYAAYHAVGFNTTTIGISGAMHAAFWPDMTAETKAAWIDVFATMAADVARWLNSQGKALPDPRLLTRDEAKAGVPGFVSHARLDPSRRSDPGDGFPWTMFFAKYKQLLATPEPPKEPTVATTDYPYLDEIKEAQRLLGVDPDGWFGPVSLEALNRLIIDANADVAAAEAETDRANAELARAASIEHSPATLEQAAKWQALKELLSS